MKKNPMYLYLLILTLCTAGGLQGWRTLFNNFSVQIVGLDGNHIGIIQSVREFPGFLTLFVIYTLLFIKEHRLAALAVLIMGLGIAITGFFPTFYGIIFTTLMMSLGFHYFETTNQSLTLQYFTIEEVPMVFGLLRSRAAACNIAVGIFFLIFSPHISFVNMFLLFGIIIAAVALWVLTFNPTKKDIPIQKKRIIIRKSYWLFYLLTLLAGARRQIFVAFAVFLLVKKFDFDLQEIAALFLLNNCINLYLSPLIGRCIVKFGERSVLSLEYAGLILIFCGYALVEDKYIAALLYILDHILYNGAIAIKTFFQKIVDPGDIAPSMAVGFTINHIAAVVLPALGGLLWLLDYRIVFLAGAVLSLLSLVAVQSIPRQLQKSTNDGSIKTPYSKNV